MHHPGPPHMHPQHADTEQIPMVRTVEPMHVEPMHEIQLSYVLQCPDKAVLGQLGVAISAAVAREADGLATVLYHFGNTSDTRTIVGGTA